MPVNKLEPSEGRDECISNITLDQAKDMLALFARDYPVLFDKARFEAL
jgi:hypothetical protein